MKCLKYLLRLVDGLLDRLIAVLGVAGMAQFPQFYSQYFQRLGGHLAEAKFQLVRYELTAEYFNLSLEEYIAVHVNSGNEVLASSGQIINDLVNRIAVLEQAYNSLQAATPWTRGLVFLCQVNLEMFQETWAAFTPGIPTTFEGAVYGLMGLIFAWGIYLGIKAFLKLLFRLITSPFSSRRRVQIPPNLLAK